MYICPFLNLPMYPFIHLSLHTFFVNYIQFELDFFFLFVFDIEFDLLVLIKYFNQKKS